MTNVWRRSSKAAIRAKLLKAEVLDQDGLQDIHKPLLSGICGLFTTTAKLSEACSHGLRTSLFFNSISHIIFLRLFWEWWRQRGVRAGMAPI